MIERCRVSDGKEKCLNCKDGYYPKDRRCDPVNCLTIAPNGECTTCLLGLIKDGGICKDRICDIFDPWYRCQRCKTPDYFDLKDGKCDPKNSCPQGFYLNSTNCVKIPSTGCQYLNIFNLDQCLLCGTDYFLYQGICYSLAGCNTFSYFYGCYNCKSGYSHTQERFCVERDPFC